MKLLVRTTRRITLTHEGSAFLEDCQRLLADIANAEASVSAGGVKASGHLRITAPAGFGRRHVAPLVPRFRELHPDVTISLNLSDRVVDLAGEGFDCAVRVGDLPDSSLVSVRLADNRRLCVATPDYLQRHGTPEHPNDLARFDCLTLSSDASQTRGWAFRAAAQGAQAHGASSIHLKPGRPARLLRRPGAARLVPAGLRHRLAQHLGGGGRDRRRPAGRGAGRLRRAAQRHLRRVSAAQAPAAAGAAVDRLPQAALRPARVLERRQPDDRSHPRLRAALHPALVVFISSEAALCRLWLNARVERLALAIGIYGIACLRRLLGDLGCAHPPAASKGVRRWYRRQLAAGRQGRAVRAVGLLRSGPTPALGSAGARRCAAVGALPAPTKCAGRARW